MKELISLFVLSCLLFLASAGNSQERITVSGQVIDAASLQAISYATVYNRSAHRGTITAEDGSYILRECAPTDTIEVSFIGYRNFRVSAEKLAELKIVRLEPNITMIEAATVIGDNSYLYRILANCRRSRDHQLQQSRTYYALENYIDATQVELVEGYYNGKFRSGDIGSLDLKNGRCALRKFGDTYHFSLSTSRAFQMQTIYEKSPYFPRNPLEYSARKMKERYDLTLLYKRRDDRGNTLYTIAFEPKAESAWFFSGEALIDSASNQLLRIDLEIENAAIYPFVAINPDDRISEVGMRISRTFTQKGEQLDFHHMDFDYSLTYTGVGRDPYTTETHAVLFAYASDSLFTLPFFDADLDGLSDYRIMNACSRNDFFWDYCTELRLSDADGSTQAFYEADDVLREDSLFAQQETFQQGFLAGSFYFWGDDKRVVQLNQIVTREQLATMYWDISKRETPYLIDTKLYADMNYCGDSVNYLSKAAIDPIASYYNLPQDARAKAFINIYVDLAEIERRKLEEDLVNVSDPDEARLIFDRHSKALEELLLEYTRDVDRGYSEDAFNRWNEYVYQRLGIDNLSLFKVTEEGE